MNRHRGTWPPDPGANTNIDGGRKKTKHRGCGGRFDDTYEVDEHYFTLVVHMSFYIVQCTHSKVDTVHPRRFANRMTICTNCHRRCHISLFSSMIHTVISNVQHKVTLL